MSDTKGIYIIDDQEQDYENLSQVFHDNGWETLPSPSRWKQIWNKSDLNEETLWAAISEDLTQLGERINVILLDITLFAKSRKQQDNAGLDFILQKISRYNHLSIGPFRTAVPIIAITSAHNAKILRRTALTSECYVDAFFDKHQFPDDLPLVVYTASSLSRTYRYRVNTVEQSAMLEDIRTLIQACASYHESTNKKLLSVQALIEGGQEQCLEKLDALFTLAFSSLNQTQKNQYLDIVGTELFEKSPKMLRIFNENLERFENSLSPGIGFRDSLMKGDLNTMMDLIEEYLNYLDDLNMLEGIPAQKVWVAGTKAILQLIRNRIE